MPKKTFFSLLDRVQKDFSTIRGSWDTKMRYKNGKSGRGSWLIGSKMNVFQDMLDFLHQILMKLWRNVHGMKIMKTGQFGPILAPACPSFRPKLGHFWSQNIPVSIYIEFGSSDLDETLRKCSWYVKNEDLWVCSHVRPFLPRHAHHLSPN